MTPDQQKLIDQARLYAEQDEYAVTRAHTRNLLAIIEGQAVSVPDASLLEELKIARGLIAEICTVAGLPLPTASLRRIDAALAAAPEAPKP